jgi:hypothetical protein
MLEFKIFGNAAVTISGIELAQKIKKGQFDTTEMKLGEREQKSFGKPLWQRKFDQIQRALSSLTRFAPQPALVRSTRYEKSLMKRE